MTRRTVLTTLAMTVVLIACGEGEKEKSLAVRLYEHRLKRCQAMMPKDELDQCSPRPPSRHGESGHENVPPGWHLHNARQCVSRLPGANDGRKDAKRPVPGGCGERRL